MQKRHSIFGGENATTRANPGMASLELNTEEPASIAAVTKKLSAQLPTLNVLINSAGIMQIDDAADAIDDGLLVSTVTTNLLARPDSIDFRTDRPPEEAGIGGHNLQQLCYGLIQRRSRGNGGGDARGTLGSPGQAKQFPGLQSIALNVMN